MVEITIVAKLASLGAHGIEQARTEPEMGEVSGVGEREECVRGRVGRRPVVQDQRGARGEDGDGPVPHHPASGRVEAHAITRAEVTVQPSLDQVLDQHAPRAVHQALGLAGGAGGEEDVRRVVEGKHLGLQGRATMTPLCIGEQIHLE